MTNTNSVGIEFYQELVNYWKYPINRRRRTRNCVSINQQHCPMFVIYIQLKYLICRFYVMPEVRLTIFILPTFDFEV